MFSEVLEKIDWDATTEAIYAKSDADVRRALAKNHLDVEDFMALISPAAEPYLETMAQLSYRYTRERFGNTMQIFIPLYITNSCTNSCVYCGFHVSNPMKRTILTEEEMVNEYKAIKKLGPTVAAAFIKTIGLAAAFLPCAVALGFRNEELVALLIMLGSPTTPSAYVMSKNMGHEGVLTSSCIALTTLLSALTLTGWIFILRSGGYL